MSIKLKILEAKKNPEIKGIILDLVKESDGLYKCKKSGYEVIDAWDELIEIEKLMKKATAWELTIFIHKENRLLFIDEIERL